MSIIIGKNRDTDAPAPGTYDALIISAELLEEKQGRDGSAVPACVRIRLDLGDGLTYTDRVYLRESVLWRLDQLSHALGLPAMELLDFLAALPDRRVTAVITQRGEYLSVRYAPPRARVEPAQQEDAGHDEIPF